MPLSGSRLNSARYTSALSDIQAKFPIPGGLLAAEQSALQAAQQNLAHAIADHLGTDVVTEITGNALVASTSVTIPSTASPGSPSSGATSTSTVS